MKPDQEDDDLVQRFALLNRVLRVIARRAVPKKEELEAFLLGG
jgi:hypothetical protein